MNIIIVEHIVLGIVLNHAVLSSMAAGYDLHAGHGSKLLCILLKEEAYSHGCGKDPG